MREEQIPLTFRTPPLSLNVRRNHFAAHRLITAIHDEVKARTHRWEPFTQPVEVELLWMVYDGIARDVDNPMATVKALVDGLVRSGVLPRDDRTFVRRSFCTITRLPKEPGAVKNMRLIIREIA